MNWNMPFWGVVLFPLVGLAIFLLVVWSLYWKGRALWLSARKGEKLWFVVLLLVNTLGILEILYIYHFSKKSSKTGEIENKEA
ncbi:MAG: DUF5652 family protein [bacterium]|nr:DUF5652 family protein [bacterium]